MPTLGTKKFWKPAIGSTATQKENQILKNSGYINIQLVSVSYLSKGNFWQNTFGGKDKIALGTTLKYETGVESIEATSVQDVREVKVNNSYNLGLSRNIAVKVPANANAISMTVQMTAIKDDLLQAKFDMLNKPEFQSALQLAPTVVGQVLTITSLAKKLFTDSDPGTALEAAYAGIISSQSEEHPIDNGRLTKGLLIMISTNDGEPFNNVDETKFEIKGDTLYYNNKQVENTYIIFNITFDQFKGDDETSNWFKKYNEGLNNLDKIQLTDDENEKKKIFNDSKTLWIEGNALIDADTTYINSEKIKIKTTAIRMINDKYNSLTQSESFEIFTATDILRDLIKTNDFQLIEEALPATSSYLNNTSEANLEEVSKNDETYKMTEKENKLSELIKEDTEQYLMNLKEDNIKFHLGNIFNNEQSWQIPQQDELLEGYGLRQNSKEDECDDHVENEGSVLEALSCALFPRPWVGKKWRVAESLKTLISQVNALAPTRSKKSDGTIGDVAHAQRDSDHNPWVLDDGGISGIVTALDITHDPINGCNCNALAKSFQNVKDKRIKYVIWNKQIMSSSKSPWTWRPYSGSNPHNKHIHISVYCDKDLCDLNDKWNIMIK